MNLLPHSLIRQHTPKTEEAAATTGRATAAEGRQQEAGTAAIAPRRTAQHTVRVGWTVLVLAPFPHVASHVVQAILVRSKAPHR